MVSENNESFLKVGESYLIKTVTLYYTGRIVAISSREIVLEDAAWIADTGRFSECLKTGSLNDVEPFTHNVIISRDVIVDATVWTHALPRSVK